MRYQVVGECAHVVVTDVSGVSSMTLLYKGAPIPDDIDPARLTHLLDAGLVVEVAGEPIAPNAPVGPGSEVQQVGPDDEVDADEAKRRADAAGKLDEIGGAPDGRHSEDVWVEFAVRQGFDRAEAKRAGKDELRKVLAK